MEIIQHWLPYLVTFLVTPKYCWNVIWGAGHLLGAVVGVYRPHPGNYFLNVALGLDQFCNALAAGDPRETISSRAGKGRAEGKPWACLLCKFLGVIASRLAGKPTDHCAISVEPALGGEAVDPD